MTCTTWVKYFPITMLDAVTFRCPSQVGRSMRVQRVVMRDSGEESWTLLAEDHGPVESMERFLSYHASIEKSPNTVKAYAHDLKDWFIYLDARDAPKVRTRDSAPVPRGRDLTPIGLRRGRVPRRGGGSARAPGRHPRRVLTRGVSPVSGRRPRRACTSATARST